MMDLTTLVAYRERDVETKKIDAIIHQMYAMIVFLKRNSFYLQVIKDMSMTKNVQAKLKKAVRSTIVVVYIFVKRTK